MNSADNWPIAETRRLLALGYSVLAYVTDDFLTAFRKRIYRQIDDVAIATSSSGRAA